LNGHKFADGCRINKTRPEYRHFKELSAVIPNDMPHLNIAGLAEINYELCSKKPSKMNAFCGFNYEVILCTYRIDCLLTAI